jgi:hypothetical protein
VLLLAAWTLDAEFAGLLAAGAVVVWQLRSLFGAYTLRIAQGLLLALGGWACARSALACTHLSASLHGLARLYEAGHMVLSTTLVGVLVFGTGMAFRRSHSFERFGGLACALLLLPCGAAIGNAFMQQGTVGTPAEIAEFRDWRELIPENSNVQILPSRNSASFIWFTLRRPSYLTVDQSSGVVFSPVTAAEIRRRSAVLQPVNEPDWRIATRIRGQLREEDRFRPLTADRLRAICQDPALGFVIARESVGFAPTEHTTAGPWHGWNLYQCAAVRGPP